MWYATLQTRSCLHLIFQSRSHAIPKSINVPQGFGWLYASTPEIPVRNIRSKWIQLRYHLGKTTEIKLGNPPPSPTYNGNVRSEIALPPSRERKFGHEIGSARSIWQKKSTRMSEVSPRSAMVIVPSLQQPLPSTLSATTTHFASHP